MASIIRYMSLLIVCSVVAADKPIQSDEKEITDFISVLIGTWSNKEQVANSVEGHDLIEGYSKQVEIPAFPDKYWVYVEQAVNHKIVELSVMEVTVDTQNKDMIRLKPYQFTDPRRYSPWEFNLTNLQNLTSSDLKHDPDCVDNLVRMSEGVYSGICAMCHNKIGGRTPGYAITVTCDVCTGAFPLSADAKATTRPYIFRLIGEKFQPLKVPAGYVNPCTKNLGSSTNSTLGSSTISTLGSSTISTLGSSTISTLASSTISTLASSTNSTLG